MLERNDKRGDAIDLMPFGVVDVEMPAENVVDPDQLDPAKLQEWLMEIANQPRWRLEAEKCDAYYEGKQLDAEVLLLMEERGQAPIIENHVQPLVNSILGMQAKMRVDTKVAPEAGETNSDVAEALNVKLKQASTMCRVDRAKSDAYADEIKTGIGWVEISRNSDPFKPPYRYERVPRREIWWDWRAKKPDLSDARYLIRKKWMDVDVVKARFKDKAGIFDNTMAARMNWDYYVEVSDSLSTGQQDEYTSSWNISSEQYEWMSTNRTRVLIYEIWYRVVVTGEVVILPNGKAMEVDRGNPEHEAMILSGMYEPREATYEKVRVAFFAGPNMLSDTPSPYKHRHFPYVPFFGYREEKTGVPFGVIRSMIPKQDEINAHLTKMIWAINSRWVEASENAVDDHDVIRDEVASPNAYIVTKSGTNTSGTEVFKIHENQQIAAQQFSFYQASKEALQTSAGIHNATLGRDSGATSGLAINSLVEQDTITLAEINDNYTMAARHADEILLSLIIEDLSDTNDERVTVEDDFGVKREIVLNQMVFGPDGKQTVENDVTKVDVEVVLEDTPSTPTFRNQQLNQLGEVLKVLPPAAQAAMMPEFLMATDLPRRKEMANLVASALGLPQMGQDDPIIAQLRAENEQLKAELEKKQPQAVTDATVTKILAEVESIKAKTAQVNVQALFEAMQAAGLVVTNQAIVPVADSIAKSSGFVDHDGGELADMPVGNPQPVMPQQPDTSPNTPVNPVSAAPEQTISPEARQPSSAAVGVANGIETMRNESV